MLDYLLELDKQLLLWFNGSDSLFLDEMMDAFTTTSTWIPLYLSLFYLVIKNNNSMQKILLIVACAGFCLLFAGAFDDLIVKPSVARWRPTHDPQIGPLVDVIKNYRGSEYGFFSAHASNTFSIALFFCLLVRSRLLSFALVSWSLLNCYTRMYLGLHYPSDILCGLLWGTIVGGLVYMAYCRISLRLGTPVNYTSSLCTSTGYMKREVEVVVCVLLLTFVYVALRACVQ